VKYKIYNQDVMEWAAQYEKAKFHALISDTPYHLQSIVKRFGKKGSAPAKHGTDGVFSRSSKGFMGQTWDGGDIAFRPETWEALGEHLYPGAFGMCFSASRNWHRLAVAIEDAGFIIHPTIFGWLNGQGFPKATNISKQLHRNGSDNEETWEGHRYGLQALKPAVEPIIVFQKPYEGRPLDNIIKTGAGAINIEGGRIAVDVPVTINRFTSGAKPWGNAKGQEFETVQTTQGRWPANYIMSESVAERLDVQSGNLTSGKPSGKKNAGTGYHGNFGEIDVTGIGDSGGASRFFFNVQEQIDEADPIYYCGKVSPKERNAGLDDLPDTVFAQSGGAQSRHKQGQDEYKQDSMGYNRISIRKNGHPTVKPIALARYLATLLLPPEEYAPRRILVPFSGVGSEMIGAALAGWEHIVGIEFDTENGYVEIAHKRMEYWMNQQEKS
jgi:DNA modification methylase